MIDLNLSKMNNSSPYHVGKVKDGVYVFQTDTGIIYSILFKPDMDIAGCPSYQFVIDRQSNNKVSHSKWVKDTIISIILGFFENNNDILLYICDTDDGREANRNRLFIKWFTEAADKSLFTIKLAHCKVEHITFYGAIVLMKTHHQYDKILKEFEMMTENLSAKP